jgi:hypothetical protein
MFPSAVSYLSTLAGTRETSDTFEAEQTKRISWSFEPGLERVEVDGAL